MEGFAAAGEENNVRGSPLIAGGKKKLDGIGRRRRKSVNIKGQCDRKEDPKMQHTLTPSGTLWEGETRASANSIETLVIKYKCNLNKNHILSLSRKKTIWAIQPVSSSALKFRLCLKRKHFFTQHKMCR